jgi:hypothetical protein
MPFFAPVLDLGATSIPADKPILALSKNFRSKKSPLQIVRRIRVKLLPDRTLPRTGKEKEDDGHPERN